MDCDYPVNATISSYMSGLMLRFHDNKKIYNKAKELSIRLNSSILRSVGWVRKEDEDGNITALRSAAIRGLGESRDSSTVKKCKSLFEAYVKKGKEIEVNIRAAVYMTMALEGGETLFNKLIEMYEKQNGGEEIMKLSAAIGNFREPELSLKALNFSLSKNVRSQDKNSIVAYVSLTPSGRKVILGWFKRNWKKIRKIYMDDFAGLGRFVEDLSSLDQVNEKREIERFSKLKENHFNDVNMSLNKTLESIEANIRFVKNNKANE
jgi:aminopeptidase N